MSDTPRVASYSTKPDAVWFKEVMGAGELLEVDENDRPPGMLWQISFQWTGHAEEVNLEFFEAFRRHPNARKCNGTSYIRDMAGMYIVDCDWNRLTRPCLGIPIRGANVCRAHGGSIPAVRAAAERALAEASEVVALRLIGLTAPKDELDALIAHKDRISAANSVLDRAGIKGGVDVEVNVPGFKKVLDKLFADDAPTEE